MTESVLRGLFSHPRYNVGELDVSAEAGQRLVLRRSFRSGLTVGCAISIGLAGYMGDPGGFTHADPALARLLRGMALIKAFIALAIVAAVWWRFGQPVKKRVAVAYLMGSWILMGSTTLIWQLSWIPLAAIFFHAGALSMLFVSWREH